MLDKIRILVLVAAVPGIAFAAGALGHHQGALAADPRPLVRFPEQLRIQTLHNMRDHLLAMQEIQDALASAAYARAGDLAEERLGLGALKSHGAHEAAKHMPAGMRAMGSAMHRAASRFALTAHEAAATGEPGPTLAALAQVTQQCVACHAAYRLQ